jgi:hypothetical protein
MPNSAVQHIPLRLGAPLLLFALIITHASVDELPAATEVPGFSCVVKYTSPGLCSSRDPRAIGKRRLVRLAIQIVCRFFLLTGTACPAGICVDGRPPRTAGCGQAQWCKWLMTIPPKDALAKLAANVHIVPPGVLLSVEECYNGAVRALNSAFPHRGLDALLLCPQSLGKLVAAVDTRPSHVPSPIHLACWGWPVPEDGEFLYVRLALSAAQQVCSNLVALVHVVSMHDIGVHVFNNSTFYVMCRCLHRPEHVQSYAVRSVLVPNEHTCGGS